MTADAVCTATVIRELDPALLDGLPLARLVPLFGDRKHAFLLDSALDDGRLGRFSFLGGEPAAVLTARRQAAAKATAGETRIARIRRESWKSADGRAHEEPEIRERDGDPFAALRALRDEYWPAGRNDDTVLPFTGGLLGYFGYEAGRCLEAVPETARDDLGLPDVAFAVLDEVLAWDHLEERLFACVTGRGTTADDAVRDADLRAAAWPRQLEDFVTVETARDRESGPNSPAYAAPLGVRAHFDRESYCAAVERCREHIRAGDVFEVCLTHRLETDQPAPAREIYRELRRINPAPFAAYLQFPDFQIVSASPERFLHLDTGGRAESRPIKGTRPRGATPAEDERLRSELAASPKDRAENLMIVDLVRSDLGRVAGIGSVEVPELLAVEEYATVFQLVSTVRARLRDECDAIDLVRACFPGGSMTGAPKIEAMKIIDSIEPVTRGVYSGAIGYLDRRGGMDLSIVIRTIVCRDGHCTLGVGGAVIADSDPAAEYQETLDKARALLDALNAARGGARRKDS